MQRNSPRALRMAVSLREPLSWNWGRPEASDLPRFPKNQAWKTNPNLNFWARISSSGVVVFHTKGLGPKSSVCPSKKTGKSNYFGGISRNFAGISRGRPKSLRKKVWVQFSFPKKSGLSKCGRTQNTQKSANERKRNLVYAKERKAAPLPDTAKFTDLDVTVLGFSGPGLPSARQVLCGGRATPFLYHFSAHLSSVLGRTELCHEVWTPGPQKPQIISNENHHWALLDSVKSLQTTRFGNSSDFDIAERVSWLCKWPALLQQRTCRREVPQFFLLSLQDLCQSKNQKNSRRLWRSQRRKSRSVPEGGADFPAAIFLAGKCLNLGRDSISCCRKIGEC